MVRPLARHLRLDDQETRQLLEASLTALAPYLLVPLPRNPFFTGREEVLKVLHTQLGVDRAVALTQSSALYGLGGVGKTQIALEYAYRHALEYSAVFWIGAETEEQMVFGLLQIAEVLHLPGQDDKGQQRVVAAVQHWLATHGQWLLIVDNVEDLTLLDRFLPSVRSGAILLTTRSSTLGTWTRGLDLTPMEPDEGLLLLLRRAKILASDAGGRQVRQFAEEHPIPYRAATTLVETLGGLPLALDQAGAYLEATRCGLSAYLDLFHTRRAALLRSRGEGARDHPASVSTTFTLALTSATKRHPAVGDLLRVCALLQPDAIPEELFCQGVASLGGSLATVCREPLEWDRVLAVACSSSLLSRQAEGRTLSLHRLVQAVLLDAMTEAEREQWSRRVLAALDAVFPDMLPTTADAVWERSERLWPQALFCLHRAGSDEESLVFASVADKTAQCLRVRTQYQEAELLSHRALHIRESVLGPVHPEVASSLHALAFLCWEQGRDAEAERLYQRALSIWEQTLGPNHPDVARTLNNLAILCVGQGKANEAEALYQRALQIWEQALDPDHPLVASGLNNLAELYQHQGRNPEAELLYRRAWHIWEQTVGPDHHEVSYALNGLANLFRDQSNHVQAEALYQRALAIREQRLGPAHPETAQLLHDLALLRRRQGKGSEALSLVERARSVRSQFLGDTHPKTVTTRTLSLQLLQEQPGEQNEALFERKSAREASNVLREVQQAEKISRALQDISCRAQADPLQKFLDTCCEFHPRAWCRSADLWQAYEQWVAECQERYPLSRGAFSAQLKAHACRADRTKTTRIWRGIALVKTDNDGR